MDGSRVIPTIVGGLGVLLASGVMIGFAMGREADYADLSPAPDAIEWRDGEETTVWLETNRRDVELRLDGTALALGDLRRRSDGGAETVMGRSLGCQDWAVSFLRPAAIGTAGTGFQVQGNAAGAFSGEDVQLRYREAGTSTWTAATVSAGASFSHDVTGLAAGKTWEVEALSSGDFPPTLTRAVTVNLTAMTSTYDRAAQELSLLAGRGLGLLACAEADDVLLTLHGEEGAELNRYLVDVGAEAAAQAAIGHQSRRVCVDSQTRVNYLSGGELVGAALSADDFGLGGTLVSVSVADEEEGSDVFWFFDFAAITNGFAQMRVSEAGASGTLGLDADRVYVVRVTGTDTAGDTASLNLGVWLDQATISADGDGLCPTT